MAEQELVSREDIEAARRAIEAAAADGRLTAEEARSRSEKVLHAVTPHDLYNASGGLAGSPRASAAARADRRKAIYLVIGIVVFAAVVTVVVMNYWL
jgi:hypothetical protein